MSDFSTLQKRLSSHGIKFENGLSSKEIYEIENNFTFLFPEPLRSFLQNCLPVGQGFPKWRKLDDKELIKTLNWPLEGIMFDIEHNNFWLKSLGEKPDNITLIKELVSSAYKSAPKLIPIYSHRYMPSVQNNNIDIPILSVHQTDIIIYGNNLEDYFIHEFMESSQNSNKLQPAKYTIPFWSEIIENNN